MPKDTKASSEQETEVLRAGLWKEEATQGLDFEREEGKVCEEVGLGSKKAVNVQTLQWWGC